MKIILTPAQMREAERSYMREEGVPSPMLMERAARALTDEVVARLGGAEGRVCAFACGRGGNGGDGYAAARFFAQKGGRAVVVEAGSGPLTADAASMREQALTTRGVWFSPPGSLASMPRPDAWVDALFGIGLSRAPEGDVPGIIARMAFDRARGALVVACDIPSGLAASTGNAPGAYVLADATVTFQWPKPGHFLGEGMDACGELVVASIGIPEKYAPTDAMRLADEGLLRAPKRRRNTHKGDYGHLLIVAGSLGMTGAACLCAGAALRSGAGLVTVACPESVVPVVQTLEPCAMCLPLPEEDGAIAAGGVPVLREALRGKIALAVGPGLSRRCDPEIVRAVLESGLPCVLDADALNLLAADPALKSLLHANCVVTPHPGEAARLVLLSADPIANVRSLAELGCTALYKGAATLVAGPGGLAMSVSGTPGMARGGSGDVLTGIVGALLARGFSPERAALAASEAHGLAGEAAAAEFGEVGMTARELLAALPGVWKRAQHG